MGRDGPPGAKGERGRPGIRVSMRLLSRVSLVELSCLNNL